MRDGRRLVRGLEPLPDLGMLDGPADHHQPVEHLVLVRQLHDIGFNAFIVPFQIDGNHRRQRLPLRHQRQDLAQGGNPLTSEVLMKPLAGVQFFQLRQGEVAHLALPVRRAVERLIMNTDKMPVLRPPDIDFQSDPQTQARRKLASVFSGASRRTPRWATTAVRNRTGSASSAKIITDRPRTAHRTRPLFVRMASLLGSAAQDTRSAVYDPLWAVPQEPQSWPSGLVYSIPSDLPHVLRRGERCCALVFWVC